jgi:ribosomal protein S14
MSIGYEITPEILARFARPRKPVPVIYIKGPPPRLRQRKDRAFKVERCGVEQAAAILGLSRRKVQDMAARGQLPGAAKIGHWTFDVEKLRRYVQLKERQTWQSGKRHPDATGGAMPSGDALRSTAEKSDGRFTRVTRRLREQGARRGRTG